MNSCPVKMILVIQQAQNFAQQGRQTLPYTPNPHTPITPQMPYNPQTPLPQRPDKNQDAKASAKRVRLVIGVALVLVFLVGGYGLFRLANLGNISPRARGTAYCDAIRDHQLNAAVQDSLEANTVLTADQLANNIGLLERGWVTGCKAYDEVIQGNQATLKIAFYFGDQTVTHNYTLIHTGSLDFWTGVNTLRISTNPLPAGGFYG